MSSNPVHVMKRGLNPRCLSSVVLGFLVAAAIIPQRRARLTHRPPSPAHLSCDVFPSRSPPFSTHLCTSPYLLQSRDRRGPSSHLISAVRVTSTALRGVIREGDIRAFEWWNSLFVRFRRGAPPPVATTPAKIGDVRRSREAREVDHAPGHRGRGVGGGGQSAAAFAWDEAAGGESNGECVEGGGGVTGGAVGAEGDVGTLLPLPFTQLLSPVFSFEAAFGALRIEVAGDDNGEDSGVDSAAETGHPSSRGAGEDRLSSPEEAEPPRNSTAVDSASDALGGENIGLCRSSKSAGLPAIDSEGNDARRNRWDGVQRHRRREGLVRRQNDAPSAVAEAKGLRVEMKAMAAKGDGCTLGDDPDMTKV